MRWPHRVSLPEWDKDPPDDAWSKWAWGVTVPALVGLIALRVAVTAHATWPGRHGRWATVDGWAAEGIALALFGLASYWHAHYCWILSPRFHGVAQLGKVAAVMLGLAGIGIAFWQEFRPM
jgi:hypothetical protein